MERAEAVGSVALEAREREKQAFFDLAERLTRSSSSAEQKRIKEELARMTFGD